MEQQNSQEISTPSEEASTKEFLGPSKLPKGKTTVIARTKNNEWKTYNIISRAGKSTGKYSTWLNGEDNSTKEIKSVDWKDHITEWKEVESQEILISEAQPSFELIDAKLKELEKWKQFDVHNEVPDNGQNTISVRWVRSTKDGKVKARLCASGFEDRDLKETRTDSPTCVKQNLRLVFAIIFAKKWRINSLDIQSAFLQGQHLERDIYLKPLKDANTKNIWKQKKCIYGLSQAPRLWYLKVSEELQKLGVKKSKYDEAIFFLAP